MPLKQPVKIVWVISDGIPGHFNQSKGILLALQQLALQQQHQLQVEWVELRLRSGLYRRLLGWLLNHSRTNLSVLSLSLLPLFYRGQLPTGQPDMVVGAGGKSAFAVAWLGQFFQAQTIFAGSLRQLKASLFDAILILEPDAPPPFISLQTSPMPINQELLTQAAEQWRTEQRQVSQTQAAQSASTQSLSNQPLATTQSLAKPLWAILIGGDGAGAVYQDSDWHTLALQLNAIAQQQSIQWLLTTSRRTGAAAEAILKQHINSDVLADAVWWSVQPRAVTSAYLGLSELVMCTVDSMSMMMESVSALRPVVSLIPQQFKPDAHFQAAIDRLQQQKLVQQQPIQTLDQSVKLFLQLQPLTQEPSLKLADALQKRLYKNQ